MKANRIAMIGIGLAAAAASSAAFAMAGDTWYGTYRGDTSYVQVEPSGDRYVYVAPYEVTRVEPAPPVVYEQRYYVVPERRVIVEGDRYYVERPYYRDYIAELNPQTGQFIGHGLFNDRGPNDFGG